MKAESESSGGDPAIIPAPMLPPPVLLTIAGSDSGGAAGLQADLKTAAALGVYAACAVTVVTAQNSLRVETAHFLPPAVVAAQIDAVLSDYGAAAIKTGFIGRVDLIETIAERLAHWRDRLRPFILIDPVLVNHRAEAMFGPDMTAAYRRALFPLADLITPNRQETVLLGGDPARPIETLPALGARRVLLKGLPDGEGLVDVLWEAGELTRYPHDRINTPNLHGSGDTLSAAICAEVARGHPLPEAIGRAQAFTLAAIRRGAGWRLGGGHGPLGHAVP
jgi:hydroxymethylpyrimidine/phosphomethylpyrimidine kinase